MIIKLQVDLSTLNVVSTDSEDVAVTYINVEDNVLTVEVSKPDPELGQPWQL